MSEIWVERLKWPSAPHYAVPGRTVGEDEYGLWIELAADHPVYRGDEILFHGSAGLVLAPGRAPGWLAWFPSEGAFDLYVDIVTDLTRTDGVVTMIDLDLDVVRRRTGEIELLDEDEFATHQVELGYPAEVVEAARRDADFVMQAVTAGTEPFGGLRAAEWRARLGTRVEDTPSAS
ncbi:MAG: DUF402 domain-containing protein [Acidimicrobiales bacterium]